MANEIEVAFERLLKLKEEYEGKLAFAKDMDDKDEIIHYQGACEGFQIAITAFGPYIFSRRFKN